ncbi:carbohydrate kinase family protein [Agrobacterium fabrum]|uniref:Sugar or nucleoside kinase, ribokinase family n=1 Tax=Agrobacterium fabrum TaxID=1176649 RepID=A0A7Z7FP82_9HYPH|nr:carbohydrate kinase family protein [Agrobacterium fabrum]MCR6724668.1 carbohydrate kinase family protein [Agrobacterium fabrum]WCK75223.1 carbohydrate kinase family protein [Agrobacterium fabrum]WIE26304.1 carbohydrate kinase family protein [Agrobacterium fabrum]WIE42261.1 carbohydrate kinase family protein [Agrobacterium fabrum]WLP52742.1 carbohydrate kinase family protein [Agrobacterium fabrum]
MKKILVLGGAHIDRRGMIETETAPGASNPGSWMEEAGGGGFNAARNLSRLGFEVRIIAPRGGDVTGEVVAEAARQAGVEDTPFTFLDRRTPSYTAILERDGNLVIALADMDLYKLFTPRRLKVRAVREAIIASDFLLCDANLPEDTLTAVGLIARACEKPLAAIAISPAKAVKLKAALGDIDILFMNEAEARALTGETAENVRDWPNILRKAGLSGGVVTRGASEVVAFNGTEKAILHPPLIREVKDVTGAGDAMASGYLAAIAEGKTIREALRQGAAAAAITVQSSFATSQDLSKDSVEAMLGLVPQAEMLA